MLLPPVRILIRRLVVSHISGPERKILNSVPTLEIIYLAVRDDCVPARECLARSGLVGRVGPRGWTPAPAVRLLRVLGQVLGAEFYFQLACVTQLAPASTLVQDRGASGQSNRHTRTGGRMGPRRVTWG